MSKVLTDKPVEGSNVTFGFTFKNNAGTAIIPDTARWTLTDKNRAIINNRRHVSATPAIPTVVTLSGLDLACSEVGSLADRLILVEGTSGGLPVVEEFSFQVKCSTIYPITTTTTTTV